MDEIPKGDLLEDEKLGDCWRWGLVKPVVATLTAYEKPEHWN